MSTNATPARRALALLGAAAFTATLLSACGSDSQPAASSAAETTVAPSSSAGDHSESTEAHSEDSTDHDHGDTGTTEAGHDHAETGDEPTATSGPATPAEVNGGAATISVTVGTDDFTTSGGTRVVSVPAGTDVTVELTDPSADQEYHLHGYDVEVAAAKGETAKVQFTADQTGQFDLESHDTGQVLLVIVVI